MQIRTAATTAIAIDSDQNVGIGTDSPTSYYSGADNLVVYQASGEAGITIATATDTTGALYFADGTTGDAEYRGGIAYTHSTDTLSLVSGGASRVTIDSDGNVGIAATPGTYLSTIRALRIGQGASFSAFTNSLNTYVSSNVRVDATGTNKAIVTGESAQYRQSDGTHIWYNAASVSAGATSTLTERMRLQTSGSTIQDVTLQLKTTGASDNAGIMFINSGNTSSFNDIAGIASFVESGSAKGNLQFWTRNSDGDNTDVAPRMTIDSSGNVNIKTGNLSIGQSSENNISNTTGETWIGSSGS
jgi:hypothetical protein